MAGIRFLLGFIPSTTKIEEADDNLRRELKEFKDYENSDELKRFYDLEKEVNSPEFDIRKKEILSQKYKNTEEYRKEQEYKKLEKSAPIRNYFKVKDSASLSNFQSFQNSDTLKRLTELENYVKSDALSKAKANLSPKEFKKSDEASKEREYHVLRKSPQVKKNLKFENSQSYREYLRIEDSEELKRYKELKEFVNSQKLKEVKDYMNLSSKKKYELSDLYKKEVDYKDLKKSDKLKWYFKTLKKYPFREIEKWELVFEENFNEGLKSDKWLSRYFYGDQLLGRPYSLPDDLNAFTDKGNFELNDGRLNIITKKETSKSLVWNPLTGFIEKELEYTSGLINTAKSFNQAYGLFKAKIRLASSEVSQSFSLMSDTMLPHIDIVRFEKNKIQTGNFWKNGSSEGIHKAKTTVPGTKYTRDFFIYSMEWSPGKLVWKINDVQLKTQTQGVPAGNMYMIFNASLKDFTRQSGIPSRMIIDWVRVYKLKPAE